MTDILERGSARPSIADDEELRWIAQQTNALIEAAGSGDVDRVYHLAGEASGRTLAASAIFQLTADFAVRQEDWEQAVRYASLHHFSRPDDAEARAVLVRLLVQLGASDIAVAVVESALASAPANPELMRLRLDLALSHEVDRAGAVAAELIGGPGGARLSLVESLIQSLIGKRMFAVAEAALAAASARHGNAIGLMRLAATLAHRSGLLDEADRRWRDIAAEYPEQVRAATLFRARIAIERNDREAADRFYEEGLEREPVNLEAVRHLVRSHIRRGDLNSARATLDRHKAATDPSATTVWLEAVIAASSGDFSTAQALGAQGLSLYPDDADLALRIADIHSDAGDWSGAAALLDAGLQRIPEDFNLIVRRLRAGEALGMAAGDMLALAGRGLAIRPADEGMLRTRANLLVRLGQRREAVAGALDALGHHPRRTGFWRLAIANLLNLGEPAEAQALVDRAEQVFAGEEFHDLLALAEIYEAAELPSRALIPAEQALAIMPHSPDALLLAARQLVALGRYRQAYDHLRVLQELGDRPSAGASLLARLARAIAYVDAHPLDGESGEMFPDAVFARISAAASSAADEPRSADVFHVTAGLGAGGAERQVALTVRGQQKRAGLRPVLVGYDLSAGRGRDFFLSAVSTGGVEVIDLSVLRATGYVRDLVARRPQQRDRVSLLAALPPEFAAIALPLYCLMVERRPSVVHLWQDATAVAGGIAAMMAGVPRIVLGTRSTRPVERQRLRPWLEPGYHALRAYRGTRIVNNSGNGARDYETWLGLPSGEVKTILNGFDFAAIRAPAADPSIREALGAGPGSVVFGGVMRLSFEKRPELWLEVAIVLAGQVPDLQAVLVGEGPMWEPLQARIAEAEMSDRIRLVGRQSPVEPWMKAMDLLFLSSLTEGLPNVLVEAQALGLPVATMRVGGAPETVVEGSTAIIADEGTPEEIAARLLPLALDADMRRRFGAAGQIWVEANFSDHAMLDRLDDLYADAESA